MIWPTLDALSSYCGRFCAYYSSSLQTYRLYACRRSIRSPGLGFRVEQTSEKLDGVSIRHELWLVWAIASTCSSVSQTTISSTSNTGSPPPLELQLIPKASGSKGLSTRAVLHA